MATHVIGLSGPAGSGKSEVARFLGLGGYTTVKFAGPLKAMLRAYYKEIGLPDEEIERRIEGDLKEEPCQYLSGQTPRWAMQSLGTCWGRESMHPDFWVKAWEHSVTHKEGPIVVDDVRFDNEAETVRAWPGGCKVISIQPTQARREASDHVSEQPLPEHLIDHTIENSGTLADLQGEVSASLWPDYLNTFAPLEKLPSARDE